MQQLPEGFVLRPHVSLVSAWDSCRMTGPLDTHDGTTETEPYMTYSSYFYCDDTIVAPMDPHIDPIGNTYTSPRVTNASTYNAFFPSNAWPIEAGLAFDLQFAGGIYSMPISIPFTTCFNGVETIASSGWQTEAGSCFQTSPAISLWHEAPAAPGSSDETIPSLRTLETPISNIYDHKSRGILFPIAAADDSQDRRHAELLSSSPPLKRKKCVATGSCQEFRFKSNGSGQTATSISDMDRPYAPTPFASDVSFDLPETAAHSSPIRPKSSRRTGSGKDAQRRVRSPPAKSPAEQRARNRTAAEKCRVKTKAAAAALEATERAESSRHEQLVATLRGLQAEVFALKSEVLLHGACGDGPIRDYLGNTARSLATGCGGGVAE